MDELLDTLSKSQLFGGLPEKHLREVINSSIDKNIKKQEIIFTDGDESNGFYIVVSGLVNVYKISPEGKEQVLHIVRSGEAIGAVPMFSGESYPANAGAITNVRLLFFPKQQFINLISRNPSLTMSILATLSMRLREFTTQVENLSLKDLPGRLAAYLLHQAQQQKTTNHVTLDISKSLISNVLGSRPESLSRTLATMSKQNLIRVNGSDIELIDRNALKHLAMGSDAGH